MQIMEQGIYRKNTPRRIRQRRRVALPAFSAGAVRCRLALAGRGKEASLSATKSSTPISVCNYAGFRRSVSDDNREALEDLVVEVDQCSTHIYCGTAATLVERAAGLSFASCLPGHTNEQITRTSYVVSVKETDPITVDVLDEILGN